MLFRSASLVNELEEMNQAEAEVFIEGQAQAFEDTKDDLIALWQKKEA